jgi:hypothetical protein
MLPDKVAAGYFLIDSADKCFLPARTSCRNNKAPSGNLLIYPITGCRRGVCAPNINWSGALKISGIFKISPSEIAICPRACSVFSLP